MFVILYSLYLYTSILAPITTIEITAQFLSLLFNDYTNLFNSVILVINFIVLYILVGIQATMELVVPVSKQNAMGMRVSAGLLTNETIRQQQQQQQQSTVEDVEVLMPLVDDIKGMCSQDDDKETTDIVDQQAESDHNSLIDTSGPISVSIDQEQNDTSIEDVSQEQDTSALSIESQEQDIIATMSIEDNATTKYDFLKDDPSSDHADTPDLSPPNQSTSSSISSTSSKPKHQSMIITDSMISFNSSKKTNFFSSVRLKRKSKEIQQQSETKPKKSSSSSKFTKKLSKLFKV